MMHIQKQDVPPRLKSKQLRPKHKILPQIEGTLGLFSAQSQHISFTLWLQAQINERHLHGRNRLDHLNRSARNSLKPGAKGFMPSHQLLQIPRKRNNIQCTV